MNELKGNEIFFMPQCLILGIFWMTSVWLLMSLFSYLKKMGNVLEKQLKSRSLEGLHFKQYLLLFPFLKGSGSPDEESDSRRGSEFHEQQANCGGYSDKVEEVDIQKQINL
ncbi:uncharacterized protein LOC113279744 [Papaver somniferum]|uniref:uncharacterized protein LOC113279744 n=1 Tax=Papaver somniferum TaxID=3469 RepID=UPI000E6FA614|nr:uncharacterized protein LOC113279744 [Papaver somniferum]